MKILRNILTVIAISVFLFSCEADSDIYEDESAIEIEKVGGGASDVEDVAESDDIR